MCDIQRGRGSRARRRLLPDGGQLFEGEECTGVGGMLNYVGACRHQGLGVGNRWGKPADLVERPSTSSYQWISSCPSFTGTPL